MKPVTKVFFKASIFQGVFAALFLAGLDYLGQRKFDLVKYVFMGVSMGITMGLLFVYSYKKTQERNKTD